MSQLAPGLQELPAFPRQAGAKGGVIRIREHLFFLVDSFARKPDMTSRLLVSFRAEIAGTVTGQVVPPGCARHGSEYREHSTSNRSKPAKSRPPLRCMVRVSSSMAQMRVKRLSSVRTAAAFPWMARQSVSATAPSLCCQQREFQQSSFGPRVGTTRSTLRPSRSTRWFGEARGTTASTAATISLTATRETTRSWGLGE